MGRRTFLLAKGLARRGHETHIVAPQRFRSGPLYEEIDGVFIHWGTVTTPQSFHNLSERVRARWATLPIISSLVDQQIDWLILVFPEIDRLPYLLAARRHGVRIAATYDDHRTLPPNPSVRDHILRLRAIAADRIIPRLTDLNFATSSFLVGQVNRLAKDTPVCRCPAVVDPNSFVLDLDKAAAFRAKWNLGGSLVIGYTGTYWHVEGLANLLSAARLLKQEGEQFKLAICGKPHLGHFSDDISALVQQMGLHDVVVETGWLPTEELVGAMSAADILTVPKLDNIANIAGLPAKLAEYLAMGRAVVASRVGDIPLYVEDGKDALLCKPGDVASLSEALRVLIRDPQLRQALASNARAAACRSFDYYQVAGQLESAMMSAMSHRVQDSRGHRRVY